MFRMFDETRNLSLYFLCSCRLWFRHLFYLFRQIPQELGDIVETIIKIGDYEGG